jgi:hypothetical protein
MAPISDSIGILPAGSISEMKVPSQGWREGAVQRARDINSMHTILCQHHSYHTTGGRSPSKPQFIRAGPLCRILQTRRLGQDSGQLRTGQYSGTPITRRRRASCVWWHIAGGLWCGPGPGLDRGHLDWTQQGCILPAAIGAVALERAKFWTNF